MRSLSQILANTSDFYKSYIKAYDEEIYHHSNLDVIIKGSHGKWIDFKNSVRTDRQYIIDQIQNAVNYNIAVNIVNNIFKLYESILKFIESHRSEMDEEDIRWSSREGIALELRDEIKKTINLITEICPGIRVTKQFISESEGIINNSISIEIPFSKEGIRILNELEKQNYIRKENNGLYRWEKSAKLYGFFIDLTSEYLDLRDSSNRIPWKIYKAIFNNHSQLLQSARQGVQDYRNKALIVPEGSDLIESLCK